MLTKNQLKKVLAENDMRLRKRWGQNFLIDRNIRDKIIEKAEPDRRSFVIEVGPGLGALTEELAGKSGRVVAVERDKKLCAILKKILEPYKNTTVIEGDFLDFDFTRNVPHPSFHVPRNIKVIGNLPYCITTPIIFRLLQFREHMDSALITVQKEVARRIIASPGSKDYSSLSLRVYYFTIPSIEMIIKKSSFFPQPEVDSCLVKLKIREAPPVSVKNEELLFKIIRTSFGQRRKTLANALSPDWNSIKTLLEKAGIDPKRRGETLLLEEFANLANTIDNSA